MHKVKKKKQFLSNKTSLKGSRNLKKVFLSSIQITEHRGLSCYSGVLSLSHSVNDKVFVHDTDTKDFMAFDGFSFRSLKFYCWKTF